MKKRILSILLLLLLSVGFCLPAGARVLGDANGDGAVTATDARLALRAAIGLQRLTGEQFLLADINSDDVVATRDARTILRTALGLEEPRETEEINGFDSFSGTVVDLSVGKYTYTMLRRNLQRLRALFPSRFSYFSLGVTADRRNIYCAVVGTGHGSRQIVADTAIHGSEYLNPPAVMSAVEYYLRNYDTPVYQGKTVRQLLEDTDLYIIPMLNPDGVTISQFGPEKLQNAALAAKARSIYTAATAKDSGSYYSTWKANANGVDLNRNFLFETTGRVYNSGVYVPSNENYGGNPYQPEAETAAYKTLVNSLSNPVAALSIHSQGDLIYWKCGQSAAGLAAAKKLAETVRSVTGYALDASDSFVAAAADWTMIEKNIPSVTVETGSGAHNPLPAEMLPKIALQLRDVFLAVAAAYGE